MSKGTKITYGDFAVGAKENFVISTTENEFNTLEQLKENNLNFKNFANPCELYQTLLDGTATAFPSLLDNENLGFWSKKTSDSDGFFRNDIGEYENLVLSLTSNKKYSSIGLTFVFDVHNQIYPTIVQIEWYGDNIKLDSAEFYPDNAMYFCERKVENYDKIIIRFVKLNMPYNRLKLSVIDYGYGTTFLGDELRNVKIIQEINPISSEISINTVDFTLDSKSNIQYSFQKNQPLTLYFDERLLATTFVKNAKRKSKNVWEVQSEDYISIMENVMFLGGMYENVNAGDILKDIFAVANVPYIIDDTLAEMKINGHIPYTTCRDALMQVAFAIQAVVDTSNSEVVKIFALMDDVKQTIPLERIMQGQNFEDNEVVTSVELTSHNYLTKIEKADGTFEEPEEVEIFRAGYRSDLSLEEKEMIFFFDEPLHSLSIVNGTIIESGANYAKIGAQIYCVLKGKKYFHQTEAKKKYNSFFNSSTDNNYVKIDTATLVSSSNVDTILNSCYNWLIKNNVKNMSIIEGKHILEPEMNLYGEKKYGTFTYGMGQEEIIYDEPVNLGDKIIAQTEYLGGVMGTVIKQSFNLNGGIIVKEAVLK